MCSSSHVRRCIRTVYRSLAFRLVPKSQIWYHTLLRKNDYSQRWAFSTLNHVKPEILLEPTIYALSSGTGRAAIAVIRISGPGCSKILSSLCPNTPFPKPRHATVRSLHDPSPLQNYSSSSSSSSPTTATLLDSTALVLSFPAPRSTTGEDVLEFHIHGGPATIRAVLTAISRLSTAATPIRYAEPGEFTRRAFLNDRLSLPQIEALGDTLAAVTEEQRRLSIAGTVGGQAARYESWREALLAARGELEALIDFSEDQHFDESPGQLARSVAVQVRALAARIAAHSANAVRGELLRNGIGISLIGAPNAGKSSLLNLIVGRNAAIVSSEAGTTRDVVEVGIDLGGFFCRLGDTAGLRGQSSQLTTRTGPPLPGTVVGEVEQEGIRRAKANALASDVVILVLSIERSIQDQGAHLTLNDEILSTARELLAAGKTVLVAVNKMDVYGPDSLAMTPRIKDAVAALLPQLQHPNDTTTTATSTSTTGPQTTPAEKIFCISCLDPTPQSTASIQPLLIGLLQTFKSLTNPLTPTNDLGADPSEWHEALGATERQRTLLDACHGHLAEFLRAVGDAEGGGGTAGMETNEVGEVESVGEKAGEDVDIVLAAESLRSAAACLGRLTGRGEAGDVEEVLGVVFGKFCVGK